MVEPSYSESRRSMAHGLGRKAGQVVDEALEEVAAPVKKPVKRARLSVAEAKRAAREHLGEGGEGTVAVLDNADSA